MPRGPQGQKPPRDTVSNAVKVKRTATGEEGEEFEDDGKNPAAQVLGARGGKARAAKPTLEQRSEIARKAARERWKNQDL